MVALRRCLALRYFRERFHTGQLALRFPGDLCPGDSATASAAVFEGVRKGWHIDGCASGFVPGVTDHYGHIHNFDALVGVLLSDVPEPLSGELCIYPGRRVRCGATQPRRRATAGVPPASSAASPAAAAARDQYV